MANNYCQSSSRIDIPRGKEDLARRIIDRIRDEHDESDGDLGYIASAEENGEWVWIYADEFFNPGQAAVLVRALVEELEIDEVVVVSWAFTCSKPRIDEFGGGAFAIKRGYETVWIDAACEAGAKLAYEGVRCQPS